MARKVPMGAMASSPALDSVAGAQIEATTTSRIRARYTGM